MIGKISFFSLACLTAMLFLLPVVMHATALRAPDPAPVVQDDTGLPNSAVTNQDIRDIYGPILLPEPVPYLLYGAGFVLAVLLIGGCWILWLFIRKRKKNDHIDPAVLALSSLEEAEKRLPESGVFFFAGEVSRILRSYIEAQFSVPTTSCTTSEFFASLETSFKGQLTNLSNHDDILKQCLSLCDKIKFSRFLPEHEAVNALTEHVRSFIAETQKQPAEEK